jgi:hypothetical protein
VSERRTARKRASARVDRSIRLRVRIYALIFLVMVVIVVMDAVAAGASSILPVLACLVGGFVIGQIASRMFSLSWDKVSEKVVGRLDVLGVIILLGYVTLSVFRTRLLGLWLDETVLGVASLAALAGIMAGQVLGTSRGVIRVFRIVMGEKTSAEQ